jgi:hypothetical protein
MEFSAELRESVLAGDITVSFRLWRRPKVKQGGRYRVGSGLIEVDAVDLMPFIAISDDDLAAAGERDRESLRRRAAHAGPITDDTMLYRIEFHPVDNSWPDTLVKGAKGQPEGRGSSEIAGSPPPDDRGKLTGVGLKVERPELVVADDDVWVAALGATSPSAMS